MQQFKISEDSYKKLRKKGIWILIAMAAIAVVAMTVTIGIEDHGSDIQTWPFALPIVLLYIGWSSYRSLKKQKKFLLSYRVTITDHDISREQLNTPTLTINFMEVREIIKTKKGNFMISGLHRTDAIHIPRWIESVDILEKELQRFAPITARESVPRYVFYRQYIGIFALAMLITVAAAGNKIIVGACATLGIAAFIWAFYEVRISKNLSDNVKRKSWILLIFILTIAYMAFQKLSGHIHFF